MPDAWVAECVPCTWVEFHVTQDEALHMASHHVDDFHRDVLAHERAAKRMGHVQFRTVTAAEQSAVDATPKDQGDAARPPAEKPTQPEPKDEHTAESGQLELPHDTGEKQE
jgi:hypothetical protein